MIKALLVDNDPDIKNILKLVLDGEGFVIVHASGAMEALELFKLHTFDMAILEYALPDMDGLTLVRIIQQVAPGVALFFLSGHLTIDVVIDAFRAGVKDCFVKPVNPTQVKERLTLVYTRHQNYLRRLKTWQSVTLMVDELRADGELDRALTPAAQRETKSGLLTCGPIRYDTNTRWVYLNGRNAILPPTTGEYLAELMRHSPDPVSYEELVNHVQGYELNRVEARDLARWQVFQLRQLIEADPKQPQLVITVRNFGFKLIV